MGDDIVITGLGIMSPIGCDEQSFWDSLCRGVSGAAEIDTFDTSELKRRVACQVRTPQPLQDSMGRASGLAVAAAHQAVSNAGFDSTELGQQRVFVAMGTTMGETEFIEQRLDDDDAQWLSVEHARQIASGQPGCIARNVQQVLGLSGAAGDYYGACAAGNMAIKVARRQLIEGRCDFALAGGADGFSRLAFTGFMRARVMSSGNCRPFDEERDGLLVGEGAAVFMLEHESSARARGAKIRARLLGAALTGESYHPTRPDPMGEGLKRATELALHEAGLKPGDIDYVCAHGTGTPQNDAIEVKVLEACFTSGVRFSSIKALTGHMMGAAAAAEVICCVLSLEHQTLIPTWHLGNVLQPCSLDPLKDQPLEVTVRYVVNNAAGFGGYNASVVLSVA